MIYHPPRRDCIHNLATHPNPFCHALASFLQMGWPKSKNVECFPKTFCAVRNFTHFGCITAIILFGHFCHKSQFRTTAFLNFDRFHWLKPHSSPLPSPPTPYPSPSPPFFQTQTPPQAPGPRPHTTPASCLLVSGQTP